MVDLHLGFNGELGCSIPAEPDAVLGVRICIPWMVSGRIVHSCRLTKEVYCLIPTSGATSVCPSTSRVTCVLEGVLLAACLAGLQGGHTWWIAHIFIGGAVPI